jgi:hypothetical protein
MAAAATKHKIVILNRPLVFLAVLPLKRESAVVPVIVTVEEDKLMRELGYICLFARASASSAKRYRGLL